MSNTLLELTRGYHEDMEKLERLIVKDYKQEVKSHKEKLMQSHRVRKRLDNIQDRARKLIKIYNDEDGARKEEIDALRGHSEAHLFSMFYERLKDIKDYHKRFSDMEITEAENDAELLKEEPPVDFTGEEGLGRHLDLHELFLKFINAKFGKQMDYLDYLNTFANFNSIDKSMKYNKAYREYLESLLAYLESFYERTQPLAQMGKQFNKLTEQFMINWKQGKVPGWTDRGLNPTSISENGTTDGPAALTYGVDLDAFDSVEEVETLGADRIKGALQALGLKCGGTLRQRAERLFATKGKTLEQLDRNMFVKPSLAPVARSPEELERQENTAKEVALLETKIEKLAELLVNVISDTKGKVEKKQAQTFEELQAELEEAEQELEDDSDAEDDYIYNPLKLPLGWDGKPIPYWLYKLHGLNQEFKCEICGNYSYWGRRAFEKHFKEWRHQNGMRALGIPNNKHFYEITKIDDAVALQKTLQARNTGGFNPDVDEELEDIDGNVYNRRTYEDMKRQGLI